VKWNSVKRKEKAELSFRCWLFLLPQNGDGKVDFRDLVLGLLFRTGEKKKELSKADRDKKIKLAFRMFDSDHDGRISKYDVESVSLALNPRGVNWDKKRLDGSMSRLFGDSETITEKAFLEFISDDGALMRLLLQDIHDFLTTPSSQSTADKDDEDARGVGKNKPRSIKKAWSETAKSIDKKSD